MFNFQIKLKIAFNFMKSNLTSKVENKSKQPIRKLISNLKMQNFNLPNSCKIIFII